MPELRKLPLLMINEPPLPIREAMDEDKLKELQDSMRDVGLLQPIGVKLVDEKYEIEFGHRRYIAATRLQWIEIECKVFAPGELVDAAAMLDENLCREDITEVEMAGFCAQLMELKGLDTDGVARKLKKSRDWVEQRLLLLQGDEHVRKALSDRKINFSVARLLNSVEDDAMRGYFLNLAMEFGYTARALETSIRNWRSQGVATPATATPASDTPPVEPAQFVEEGCVLCGGNKDPYNMSYVKMHNHCRHRIEQVIAEASEAGK